MFGLQGKEADQMSYKDSHLPPPPLLHFSHACKHLCSSRSSPSHKWKFRVLSKASSWKMTASFGSILETYKEVNGQCALRNGPSGARGGAGKPALVLFLHRHIGQEREASFSPGETSDQIGSSPFFF